MTQTQTRVITRERGTIPGCRKAEPDSHMALDKLGRPWTNSPSDVDFYLAKLRAETRQSRINRGADPNTGLKLTERHLRRDLTPQELFRLEEYGSIHFESAGATRKR
jgi:hypothetical protein